MVQPHGLLTAMKQEVTRKHKADKWALDEVDYRTEVTTMERVDQCRAAPPRRCVCPWPVLGRRRVGQQTRVISRVGAQDVDRTFARALRVGFGPRRGGQTAHRALRQARPHECPVYKYPVRGDGYPGNPDIKCFIFYVTLKCTVEKPRDPLDAARRGAPRERDGLGLGLPSPCLSGSS